MSKSLNISLRFNYKLLSEGVDVSSVNCSFRLYGKWLEFPQKINGLLEPLGVTVRAIKLVGQVEKGCRMHNLTVTGSIYRGSWSFEITKVEGNRSHHCSSSSPWASGDSFNLGGGGSSELQGL